MIARQDLAFLPAGRTALWPSLSATLRSWLERRAQRRTLLALDDCMLKDIGLSRAEAWQEGTKPFWQR